MSTQSVRSGAIAQPVKSEMKKQMNAVKQTNASKKASAKMASVSTPTMATIASAIKASFRVRIAKTA